MASKKSLFDLSPEKLSLLRRFQQDGGLADGPDAPIPPRGEKGPAPLSFAQQRLWFLCQLDPDNPLYNLPGAVRLHGPLDEPALRQALDRILLRHQALRTKFLSVAGEPFAEVLQLTEFPVRVVDLSGAPADGSSSSAELVRIVTEEARAPFDLSRGPLARALLLRCGARDHVLAITIHHIATDGWSAGIILKELSALYEAFHTGAPADLAELPIQYADFAQWQRLWLTEKVRESQLGYWRKELEGEPPVLELPTDRPRPKRKRYRGGRLDLSLTRELTSKLRSLARDEGASLFMVLLAAFDILMSRYTRQQDVVVGTSFANRNRREIEPLVGFFVNTLALRTRVEDDTSFAELLARVRDTVFAADAHQDLPFEHIVEELAPERNPGRNPFFEVVFDLQRAPRESFSLAGLSFSPFEFETGTTRFDVEAHLIDGKDTVEGFLRYDVDLFDRETMLALARHYRSLLESVAAGSERRIGSLPILDESERRGLLARNDTRRDYPALSIVELFDRRAASSPQATGVVHRGVSMSYRELAESANRLAHHLIATANLAIGGRVGVCLERSPDMIVALLAILKTGCAYVPLDPSYPQERLAFMMEDARLDALVTHGALLPRLPRPSVSVTRVDGDREAIASASPTAVKRVPAVAPDDLAYVTYTSGSTGRPKGVEVTHRGVVRLLFGTDYVRLGPEETILQLAPVPFDASTFEIWGALLHGGKLVLYPEAGAGAVPSSSQLGEVLTRERVSTLWLTASLFNAVVEEAPEALSGVKQLLVGGEALSVPHIARALARLPDTTLINGYGPTEGTTFTCCFPIPRRASFLEGLERSVPIGHPIANTAVYLLDPELELVPAGVVGELFIGGDGLARGYAHRAELTAERFVPHPFSRRAGERLYRTGDLARYRSDGSIEFLGRTDEQVKVRGFRIELGEIEAALSAHAGVQEAVAVVRRSPDAEKQLVAHVVASVDGEHLRAHLTARLPEYMIPAAFVFHDVLPRSPNGKVERRALAEIDPIERDAEGRYVPPRGPIEAGLVEIWSEVLGRARVGIHQSFFALGGHSLAAVKVIARVRDSFQTELPLRALFEHPTIAELADEVLTAMGSASTASSLTPIERSERRPLSSAQRRLWLVDHLTPGGSSYNVAAAVHLEGPLDPDALGSALYDLVERHEALRTTLDPGGRNQNVHPASDFNLQHRDLSGLGTPQLEAKRIAEEEARRPIDLVAGALFQCTLLKLSESEHVLLWRMHHIITDAWSIGLFYHELGELYRAHLNRAEPELPAIEVQYGDFAAWQAGALEGEPLQRSLDYWREVLGDALAATELPADHPRPERRSYRGARLARVLPASFGARLRELGKRHGVTTFMSLLAAFDVLLSRYTGLDDVLVGTPVANRGRREIERTVGLFVNLLVLRADLSGDPSFAELLARVRAGALGAFAHQDLPFERLVAELRPERRADRNPFFQVAFALQSALGTELRLESLTVTPLEVELTSSRFDFELHVWERGDEMGVVASYDTDLFEASTVAHLLDHYETLVEAILDQPQARLSGLSMTSATERDAILDWGRASADYPAETTLDVLFAAQVAKSPDAPAIVFGEELLSYRELDRRAESIARRLEARGVGPDVLVAVYGERTPALYVAVLAVVKAGGAYVPLDPSYPAKRLQFIADDAELGALLAAKASAHALPRTDAPVVYWDELDENENENENERDEPSAAIPSRASTSASNLAYLVYTSGSTGLPKGVAVPHRGVVRLLHNTNYVALTSEDRVAQAASLSFDAATFELWGALLSGACLVGIEKNLSLEPVDFGRELRDRRVSVLFLTTALFNVMVREAKEALSGLRLLLFGGEAVDASVVSACLLDGKPGELQHVYGPTESTTFASFFTVESVLENQKTVSIGDPIANTELYVVGRGGELCPAGVPGELYIGGDGLARGYWNRPELTAEKFVPHAWGGPGERLYRTGDVVRLRLSSGGLEFLGRVDGQIKLRGHRIELGEVEAALREEAAVVDATVMVREDTQGDQRLVGYVALAESAGRSTADIRRDLAEKLPDFMVPHAIVRLDALPLTPNGKVDRAALPAPGGRAVLADDSFTPPRNALEEDVAALVRELLGVDHVGIHDNFFHLGGHSLLATELVSRVRKIFRAEIPLRDFFVSPTVEALANRLARNTDEDADDEMLLVPVSREGDVLPLSFAQKRLWFLSQLDPESAAYNIATAVRLVGPLDVEALVRSLERIVERHETLRTVFVDVDGAPVLRAGPEAAFAVERVDLTSLPVSEREQRARDIIVSEARRPFDHARGPLIRARLIRVDVDEHVFQCVIDHLLADGWSLGVLLRELSVLYRGYRNGVADSLPELSIQYADFAAWQEKRLSGEHRKRGLAYWREQLAGEPVRLELPVDFERPARRSSRGARASHRLPARLVRVLRELAKNEDATLFMTLLAGFDALLHRYTGQADIVVGTPIANRNHVDIEPLIGFFANNLVLRTEVAGEQSFRKLLARVRDVTLDGYAHPDLPFEMLVEELQPERDLSQNPLFQVTFALQSVPLKLELEGLEWRPMDQDIATARFDLELNAWETANGIELVAFYSTELFARETVERMLGHYERLLESAGKDPSTRIASLAILDGSEREQILSDWNRTEHELPEIVAIHALFEAVVASSPDAPAVVTGNESVTYLELNARANRLAHRLQSLGVGLEDRVGVCLDRSISTVVALIATLKAGACYVPLDPEYPEERLRFMLRDSNVRWIVTTTPLAARLPVGEGCGTTVRLDDVEELSRIRESSEANPDLTVHRESLAYVTYTSGSTGTPKGVAVTHRGVVRLLFGIDYVHLGPDEVILQLAPVSFDASTFEIWGALLHGGRLVLYPDTLPAPGELGEVLSREKVTTLWLTAALFNTVVDESPELLAPIRQLLVGGEALSVPHVTRALNALPDTRIVNGYGPTESTTFTCCYRIPSGAATSELALRSIPIGRPIANTEVYLLDTHLEPVPVGVAGELFIGGAGLARGYLDEPELTASRFVPSPFSASGGERLYRTGDLARFHPDGRVDFLGRVDHQVKIRGFRVELGEVESALMTCPAVRDAAVLLREGVRERELVAYLVWDGPAGFHELREYLKGKLPRYMVPSVYVALEALPLSPNGKVDRDALAAQGRDGAEAENMSATVTGIEVEGGYIPPRTPIEDLVANEWARVLGMERVGVLSDFFEIGGHSLLATQLVSRIRKSFKVEFPLGAAFEYSTVAEQAEKINALIRSGDPFADTAIPATDSELVLSYSQQRLWFFDQLDPKSSAYNMPFAVRMKGELHVGAFERGYSTVVERHGVLRSVFDAVEGRPVVRLLPVERFTLRRVDLGGLPLAMRSRETESLAKAEARRPFALREGPLVRCVLVSLSADEHVLLLTIHHIVSDGWSMAILFGELDTASRAFARGEPPGLGALPIQYADFARWQRGWLDEGVANRQLDYWKRTLDGIPDRLQLPTDWPRPKVQTFGGGKVALELSSELHRELRAISRNEGATLFMTLLAAFQILLARLSGQRDVVVGTPIAGRNRAEIEPLIGFFVNTLVLRASLDDDPPFLELLRRVRESALGAYAHQDLPFDKLVEELKPDRDLSRTPLFQVMFNYLNLGGSRLTLSSVKVDAPSYIEPDSKFDLTLYAGEQGETLQLTLVYNRDLFRRERMNEMLAQLETILKQVGQDPEVRARSISLVTEQARDHLPDPNAVMSAAQTLAAHERFAEQARRDPERLALVDDKSQWSYAALEAASNRLAHYLGEHGLVEGDTVAIYAHRSAALVWALLGVWKAGAAFVILDPAYPPTRLAGYVRQAQPKGVIRIGAAGAMSPELEESFSGLLAEIELGTDEDSAPPLREHPSTPPGRRVSPDALAYVAFTSGSTGVPKGVMGTHRPVAHFLAWHADRFDFGPDDRFALTAGLSYDPMLRDVFTPLWVGATLAVPAPEVIEEGRLREWMCQQGTTVAHLTPTLGKLLYSGEAPGLPALRYGFFGGEIATGTDVESFAAVAPNATFVNYYGTTETPQAMGYHVVDPARALAPSARVPVGAGVADVDLLVLTESGRLAGVGELGEICVRTPYLAKGYLGDEELTRRRFSTPPLGATDPAGLYRTGDLGRYLPDGAVELVGRADDQVKLRGFRVELGEIEAVLQRHPKAASSAVVCREDRDGEPRLVAYVVGDGGDALAEEIARRLSRELPAHMVPAHVVFLSALPLTPNGKLDRLALPAPEDGGVATFEAPETPVETAIAEIWEALLGVERVGLRDNFFRLGGHSLLATQLVSRVRDAFDVELPLRLIFESPTAGALAKAVSEALFEASGDSEMDAMLAEIEGLTEAELEAKLAETRVETSGGEPSSDE